MRAVFGIVSLLLALLIVGILVKKQMSAQTTSMPALEVLGAAAAASAPAGNQKEQAQQIQQQFKQAIDAQMQAPRPMLEEPK